MGCGPGPIILKGDFIYLATSKPTQKSHLPIVNKEGSFLKDTFVVESSGIEKYPYKVTITFEFNACTTSLEDGANFKDNTDIVIVKYDKIPLARTGGSGRQYQGFEGKIKTTAGVPTLLEGTDLSYAFKNVKLASKDFGTLANLDTKNVTTMKGMFNLAENFNQDISNWNMVNVTDTSEMFSGFDREETGFTSVDMVFNQPLNSWNTANVTDMEDMFAFAVNFNQPLNSWNTANARNMSYMFSDAAAFNQPLDSWNISNATPMEFMFYGYKVETNQFISAFNQPLDSWNTSNVTNMGVIFSGAISFNQPLDSWNTSNAVKMDNMFAPATKFNQDISMWNVKAVETMQKMFEGASNFNCLDTATGNIQKWKVSGNTNVTAMFKKSKAMNDTYDGVEGYNADTGTPTIETFFGK